MTHPKKNDVDVNNKSVGKTLKILSLFDEVTPMLRTTDIAETLHMNISTVSRHLNTLLDYGYLERDDTTGLYYPGLKVIALAGAALQHNDIYRSASSELSSLSYTYKVHTHMGVPKGEQIVHLISNSSEHAAELLIPTGHCHPMYCSAMGRAILAYMPQSAAREIIKSSNREKLASETKTDVTELMVELMNIKRKGYAFISNELTEGVSSLAAPVFDRTRKPVAAISISASTQNLGRPEREREFSKIVMATANRISGKLGYFPR